MISGTIGGAPPEWGPVGSIHYYLWKDVNPSPEVYNWNIIEAQLNKERTTVTLLNGQVVLPVVLQVMPTTPKRNWSGVYFTMPPPNGYMIGLTPDTPIIPGPWSTGAKWATAWRIAARWP